MDNIPTVEQDSNDEVDARLLQTEHIEAKSFEAFTAYTKLAAEATSKQIDEQDLYASYLDGIKLWNFLLDRWKQLKLTESKKAVGFIDLPRIPRDAQNADYDENTEILLLPKFMEFAEEHNGGFDYRLRVCIGEGTTVLDAAKCIPEDTTVDLICGPVMIMKNKNFDSIKTEFDYLNEFIAELLKRKDITLYISINDFVSYTEGYAGYFHVYQTGDSLMFEVMHRLGDNGDKYTFMIHDKECAERVKAHFHEYEAKFTRQFIENDVDLLARTFSTYGKNNYEETFNKGYINNLLERIS